MPGTYPQSGVQLIAKDIQKFVSDLGKASKSVLLFDQRIAALKNRIDKSKATETQYQNQIKKTQQAYDSATKTIEKNNAKLVTLRETLDQLIAATTQDPVAIKKIAKEIGNLQKSNAPLQNLVDKFNILKTRASTAGVDVSLLEGKLATLQNTGGQLATMFPALAKGLGVAGVVMAALAIGAKAVKSELVGLYNGLKQIVTVAAKIAKGGLDLVVGTFNKLLGVIKAILSPITSFISRIVTIASGMALYDFIRNLGEGFRELRSEVFATLAVFQQLEIRFGTIVANDISKRMVIPFSEALSLAKDEAKDLFDWIKRLAVTTPFSLEDISNVVALGTAMGLPVETSKRLTLAVGDMNAALGLGSEVMWRIIYNLGQMLQRGRLTGEEFRDLSRNLFPVYEVLERIGAATGRTGEQMKQLALEGGVAVNEFINEFIRLSEEKFPGAMKNLAQTWEYLIQNMKEFVNVFLGLNIFGAVFDKFTKAAGSAFELIASNEQLMIATKVIGEALARVWDYLTQAANGLVAAFGSLFSALGILPQGFGELISETDQFIVTYTEAGTEIVTYSNSIGEGLRKILVGIFTFASLIRRAIEGLTGSIKSIAGSTQNTFADLSKKAFSWGANMIAAFAKGMSSAISLIVAVIQTISALLSSWFKGSSPPKIAKNIDKWGADTLTEFIKGFGKADFSIFNSIADTIESYLRSIAYKIGDKNALVGIIKGRIDISEIVNMVRKGTLGVEEAIKKITSSVKNLSAEFGQYIRDLFAVAQAEKDVEVAAKKVAEAQKIVEAAQKKVNDITQKYDKIIDELQKKLVEVTDVFDDQERIAKINAALASGLLTDEEKKRLEMEKQALLIKQQIRDAEKEKEVELDAANKELEIAKIKEETAKAEEEAAKAKLALLKENLENSEAIIQAQIKQNNLMAEYKNLLEAAKAAAAGLGGELEKFLQNMSAGGGGFEIPLIDWDQIIADAEIMATSITESWTTAFAPLANLGAEGGPISLLFSSFETLKGAISSAFDSGVLSTFGATIDGIIAKIAGMFGTIKVNDPLMFRGVKVPENQQPPLIEFDPGPIALGLIDIATNFDKVVKAADPLVKILTDIKDNLLILLPPLKDGATASDTLATAVGLLSQYLSWRLLPVSARLKGLGNAFKVFKTAADHIKEFWDNVKEAVSKLTTFIDDIARRMDEAGSFFEKFGLGLELLVGGIALGINVILETIWAILGTVVTVISGILGGIAAYIWGWIETVIKYFTGLYDTLVGNSIIPEMMKAIYDTIVGWLTDAGNWIKTQLDNIKTWIKERTDAIKTSWDEFWNGVYDKVVEIWNGATGIWETIKFAINSVAATIAEKIAEILANWKTKWDEFRTKISDIFDSTNPESIVYKIRTALDGIKTKFSTFITSVLDPFINAWKRLRDMIKQAYDKLLAFLGIGGNSPNQDNNNGENRIGEQFGGRVKRGTPYIVGEKRPEVFVPDVSGRIIPSVDEFIKKYSPVKKKFGAIKKLPSFGIQSSGFPMVSSMPVMTTNTYDNSVNVYVDANYKNMQSPSGIRYDVSAALVAARM